MDDEPTPSTSSDKHEVAKPLKNSTKRDPHNEGRGRRAASAKRQVKKILRDVNFRNRVRTHVPSKKRKSPNTNTRLLKRMKIDLQRRTKSDDSVESSFSSTTAISRHGKALRSKLKGCVLEESSDQLRKSLLKVQSSVIKLGNERDALTVRLASQLQQSKQERKQIRSMELEMKSLRLLLALTEKTEAKTKRLLSAKLQSLEQRKNEEIKSLKTKILDVEAKMKDDSINPEESSMRGGVDNENTTGDDESAITDHLRQIIEPIFSCSICTEILIDTEVAVPCGHSFCSFCIKKWTLRSKRKSGESGDTDSDSDSDKGVTCPICRKTIQQTAPNIAISEFVERTHGILFPPSMMKTRATERTVREKESAKTRETVRADPSSSTANRRRLNNSSNSQRRRRGRSSSSRHGSSATFLLRPRDCITQLETTSDDEEEYDRYDDVNSTPNNVNDSNLGNSSPSTDDSSVIAVMSPESPDDDNTSDSSDSSNSDGVLSGFGDRGTCDDNTTSRRRSSTSNDGFGNRGTCDDNTTSRRRSSTRNDVFGPLLVMSLGTDDDDDDGDGSSSASDDSEADVFFSGGGGGDDDDVGDGTNSDDDGQRPFAQQQTVSSPLTHVNETTTGEVTRRGVESTRRLAYDDDSSSSDDDMSYISSVSSPLNISTASSLDCSPSPETSSYLSNFTPDNFINMDCEWEDF